MLEVIIFQSNYRCIWGTKIKRINSDCSTKQPNISLEIIGIQHHCIACTRYVYDGCSLHNIE